MLEGIMDEMTVPKLRQYDLNREMGASFWLTL